MVNSKTPAEDQTELLKRYKEMIRNSKHVRKEKKKARNTKLSPIQKDSPRPRGSRSKSSSGTSCKFNES